MIFWSKLTAVAVFAILLSSLFTLPGIAAEPTWTQMSPATSPPPRAGAAMAYDSVHRQIVLFGGNDASNTFGDTWVWDGSNWTNKTPTDPSLSPTPRSNHSMVYDAARGQVVLFGGSTPSGIQNDTWVWDGSIWTQKFPSTVPPKSWDLTYLAYDATRQQVVMFSCDELDYDTWVWDGSNWTLKSPVHAPAGRTVFSIAYDAVRQNVLVFGGAANSPASSLDDTWTWDGVDWIQQFPAMSPSLPRWTSAAAFDGARGDVVLFGGSGPTGSGLQSDTWIWDGTDWTQKPSDPDPSKDPPGRYAHAMAYDSAHQQIIMFGGKQKTPNEIFFGDTWVRGVSQLLSFPLQANCSGVPCTPFTAKIASVMDHSGTPLDAINNPGRWYVADGKVQAFNGEMGESAFGTNCTPGPGYKNGKPGTNFLTGVVNYVGATCKKGTLLSPDANTNPQRFLNYDGHSGYDYPYPKGTAILAPEDGQLFKAATDSVNHNSKCGKFNGWKEWHSFYIVDANGYSTWYLHAQGLEKTIEKTIGADYMKSVPVKRGQVIGFVGNYAKCSPVFAHLHFEVRKGLDEVVDPYSDGLWIAP